MANTNCMGRHGAEERANPGCQCATPNRKQTEATLRAHTDEAISELRSFAVEYRAQGMNVQAACFEGIADTLAAALKAKDREIVYLRVRDIAYGRGPATDEVREIDAKAARIAELEEELRRSSGIEGLRYASDLNAKIARQSGEIERLRDAIERVRSCCGQPADTCESCNALLQRAT